LVENKKIEIMNMKGDTVYSCENTQIEGLATQKLENLFYFFIRNKNDRTLEKEIDFY